ncbi:hypothetical protein CASFOL_035990 [Castilleja foliolosa]|uniref:Vacuolar sorting receptor thioredoxin-like domain-containing protein n=1 Tax=Castilleja foliolosa TaxID=1961234 RepID=A0ABD3BV30_9LAMI
MKKCMGNPEAYSNNPVMERRAGCSSIGKGSRGDVTILPTLVVNNRQYRGKLEKGAVLKAIRSGFEETTEPSFCLGDGYISSECPVVNGVHFKGDGYNSCVCKRSTEMSSSWTSVWIVLLGLAMAGGGAYLIYKYRLRAPPYLHYLHFQSYMDSEIRAIMAQYMPLDSQNEVPNHINEDRA